MAGMRRLTVRGRLAARRAAKRLETRFLVSQGRKAVKRKVRAVASVTRKAARTGLIAGTVAAVAVVVREVRKRRAE